MFAASSKAVLPSGPDPKTTPRKSKNLGMLSTTLAEFEWTIDAYLLPCTQTCSCLNEAIKLQLNAQKY